jgi:hypothetical protein
MIIKPEGCKEPSLYFAQSIDFKDNKRGALVLPLEEVKFCCCPQSLKAFLE